MDIKKVVELLDTLIDETEYMTRYNGIKKSITYLESLGVCPSDCVWRRDNGKCNCVQGCSREFKDGYLSKGQA